MAKLLCCWLLVSLGKRVGAQSFSVFRQRRRTNNDLESYHRSLFRIKQIARDPPGNAIATAARVLAAVAQDMPGAGPRGPIVLAGAARALAEAAGALADLEQDPRELDPNQPAHPLNEPHAVPQAPEAVELPNPMAMNEADNILAEAVQLAGQQLNYLDPVWPEAEAEVLSQAQLANLQRVIIDYNDGVAEDNELRCLTCFDNRRAYICEPCGHFAMCGRCVNIHRTSVLRTNGRPAPFRCPVCRRNLQGYRRVLQ